LTGTNYGDYLYWNGIAWAVGDSLINIGKFAGSVNQGAYGLALGSNAGTNGQGVNSVAVGYNAGYTAQGNNSVAIGNASGKTNQGYRCVAVGAYSGSSVQKSGSVSIGFSSGRFNQASNAVAIGYNAGYTGQGTNAISIGYNAGPTNQANDSICIGYNTNSTFANSIVLNAGGTGLYAGNTGFFVNPLRSVGAGFSNTLAYVNNEIVVNSGKSFVIPHPKDDKKYLVHSCLEGPESGVYYRGKSAIVNGSSVTIELPNYVTVLATDFTIQVTPIYDSDSDLNKPLRTTRVKDGSFHVFGDNCEFFWTVMGKRLSIDVEPNVNDVVLKGDGPYTYLLSKK
jgi:hypothetical protein